MTDQLQDRVIAAIGDQYDVECEIGRGGMSVVYRARDLRLNRLVAVKVLPPELAYDAAIRMRFKREAQTSAQLSHSHIVPIYDVGERDGIAYFVMALITGGNLATLLTAEPRQPLDEVRRFVCEIADALAYAHQRGIIHRDVKPDNIMIDAHSGRSMVTDFGIARAVEAGSRLTVTGIAVGTPTYMSPEQAVGEKEVDGRSDIYSLGVLAYQMLTGRVPFTGGNNMALLLKHVTERPRPIVELRQDAPRSLREAIERAMMKDPEDRWPTATALRDALMSGDAPAAAWRTEQREPVRYTSPKPESKIRDRGNREPARAERSSFLSPRRGLEAIDDRFLAPTPARAPGELVMEPHQFATFTPEQRQDIKIWHGNINLYDRVKSMRWYTWYTLAMIAAGGTGFVVTFAEGIPPFILAPIPGIYMSRKWWKRAKSLRAAGVKLRRVLLMPRAKWVLPKPPAPPPMPTEQQLEKFASREVLQSPQGAAIRRAVADRAAIMDIVTKLPKPDRALLPDVEPAVKGLVERVVNLAHVLHGLEQSMDMDLLDEINTRIAEVERDRDSRDGQQRLALLQRQRGTFDELIQRRATLARQLDSAGLALGNLRLDLVKLKSSGLSALSDVTSATQQARALSREIGVQLEAAAEVRAL